MRDEAPAGCDPATRAGRRRDHALAAGWGAAEGTVFVIVPDVWIGWVSLRSPRRSLATTVSALAGALVGGAATHAWGARTPARRSEDLLVGLPAVSRAMVAGVERDLRRHGHRALLRGPTRGVPYKVYARTSGLQRRSLLGFLAWSVPAREIRFVLVSLGVGAVATAGRRLVPGGYDRVATVLFVVGWGAFYVWFFRTVGREDSPPRAGGAGVHGLGR